MASNGRMMTGRPSRREEAEAWYEVQAVRVRSLDGRTLRRGHLFQGRELGRDLELLLAAGVVASRPDLSPPDLREAS
jgi:hypothetical protein